MRCCAGQKHKDEQERPGSPLCAGGRGADHFPLEFCPAPYHFPRGSHSAGLHLTSDKHRGHEAKVRGCDTATQGPAVVTLETLAGDNARADGNGKPGQHINKNPFSWREKARGENS